MNQSTLNRTFKNKRGELKCSLMYFYSQLFLNKNTFTKIIRHNIPKTHKYRLRITNRVFQIKYFAFKNLVAI